jgi:hypothetical protein
MYDADMGNRLTETLVALSGAGVRFVVAGGVAALLHGVERVTLDIDVSLDMEPENVLRFLAVMEALRLTPRAPVAAATLADPQARSVMVRDKGALVFTFLDRDDPLWQVDVFLTDDLAYERLRCGAVSVSIEGHAVPIADIDLLIDLKRRIQPPRPKDILDLAELERLRRT